MEYLLIIGSTWHLVFWNHQNAFYMSKYFHILKNIFIQNINDENKYFPYGQAEFQRKIQEWYLGQISLYRSFSLIYLPK